MLSAATLAGAVSNPWFVLSARLAVAVVIAGAGLLKLGRTAGFATSLDTLGIVPKAVRTPLARAIPAVEITVGVGLVLEPTFRIAALLTAGLLVLFTSVIAAVLARGRRFHCNCFGSLSSERAGAGSVLRNVLLLGLTVTSLVNGPAAVWPSISDGQALVAIGALSSVWLCAALALDGADLAVLRIMVSPHGRKRRRSWQ